MTQSSVLLIAAAVVAAAQGPPDTRPDFGQKLKENTAELQQFSYKRRVNITVKGRSRERLESVRYVDGKIETVPLESPDRGGAQPHGRGLRGAIAKKKIGAKKEEMKEEVERLRSLAGQYTPGSDSLRGALEKATVSRVGSGPEADIKVVANGILKKNDSFMLLWSTAKRRPERIEIQADFDNKPVKVTIDYESLPDGPFYAARTVLSAPAKDLTIAIDTFEYTRSANGR